MAVNLFLDSNIFLSFYALSNVDITQLTKLKKAVQQIEISLFVSDQVNDEVERNRETKIRESFKVLKDETFTYHGPVFVRELKEFTELQDLIKEANKKHSSLVSSVTSLIDSRQLNADKVIDELVSIAGIKEVDSKQFKAAHKRFLRGNPPGKNKTTIGDQINWEFLLATIPIGEDLHLVSSDGDYASCDDPQKAHSFLLREWEKTKQSQLHIYRDLNSFFRLHLPKIKLASQRKLDALISNLASSRSFANTHDAIAQFPDDSEFNDAQVIELINIKINNSQVSGIRDDADVAAFYAPISQRFTKIMNTADDT